MVDKVQYQNNDYVRDSLSIVPTEILFVGSLYKNPELYIKHGGYSVRSQYDLFDIATRFFYDCFEEMYQSYTQDFTLANVNAFMAQDTARNKKYRSFGGYQTISSWMDMANIKDCASYLEKIKKFSLLRELYRKGYNIEHIKGFRNFEQMKSYDIIKVAKQELDHISTVILKDDNIVDISSMAKQKLINCVHTPDIGLMCPYTMLNEMIRGLRTESFVVTGMLSNEGKTRYMAKLAAHTAFVCKEPVMIMLNETTEEEFYHCLITTLINNKEFYELHGIDIRKVESEISLGEYRDTNGDIIKRKTDENGLFCEDERTYVRRMLDESKEFRECLKVANWLQQEQGGKLFIKVMEDYSDQALEVEIKKNVITKGIKYFFYDTLKNDINSIGDWAALKRTATKLSELVKHEHIFLYASIQLTDDAKLLRVEDLTSNNIANAKQLKHVVDHLFFFKDIPKKHFQDYRYISIDNEWGDPVECMLDERKRYYGCITDKNRKNYKHNLIFEVDLNSNEWTEVGLMKVVERQNTKNPR